MTPPKHFPAEELFGLSLKFMSTPSMYDPDYKRYTNPCDFKSAVAVIGFIYATT